MRTRRLPALAMLCALLSCGTAMAQAQKDFGQWTAGCDNTRSCRAVGFGITQFGYGRIILDRTGAATATANVRLLLNFDSDAKQIALTATFDAPGFENIFPGTVHAQEHEGRLVLTLPASALPEFLAALQKANVLTIRQTGKPARPEQAETQLSLKGAAAALRWIDDQQKRAGGVTALIARGDAPASVVPRPPALPAMKHPAFKASVITGEMPPAVFAAWKQACDEWDDAIKLNKPQGWRIAANITLWQAPCSNGAYNFNSNFFLFRERSNSAGNASLLKFDIWNNNAKQGERPFSETSEELVNASFVEKDMAIHFFSKGRGLSDCGSLGSYVWDGMRFRPAHYASMGIC